MPLRRQSLNTSNSLPVSPQTPGTGGSRTGRPRFGSVFHASKDSLENSSDDDLTEGDLATFATHMKAEASREKRQQQAAAAASPRRRSSSSSVLSPMAAARQATAARMAKRKQVSTTHPLAHLRPHNVPRPKTGPHLKIPSPPKPPAPSKDVTFQEPNEGGRLLRRNSFMKMKREEEAVVPDGIYPTSPAGEPPKCGRFTPNGGLYVEASLGYDFDVRDSLTGEPYANLSGSKKPNPKKTKSLAQMASEIQISVAGEGGESESVSKQVSGSATPANTALLNEPPKCEAQVLIPQAQLAQGALRMILRRIAKNLPRTGTKLQVKLQRIKFRNTLVDISMSFSYADCEVTDPRMMDIFASIVSIASLTRRARLGANQKYAICPASESLCDYLRDYCIARLERDHPEWATETVLFVKHPVPELECDPFSPFILPTASTETADSDEEDEDADSFRSSSEEDVDSDQGSVTGAAKRRKSRAAGSDSDDSHGSFDGAADGEDGDATGPSHRVEIMDTSYSGGGGSVSYATGDDSWSPFLKLQAPPKRKKSKGDPKMRRLRSVFRNDDEPMLVIH